MSAHSTNPELTALWQSNRKQAVRQISKQINQHRGNLTAVARELNISLSTLIRWTERDEQLSDVLKKARVSVIMEDK